MAIALPHRWRRTASHSSLGQGSVVSVWRRLGLYCTVWGAMRLHLLRTHAYRCLLCVSNQQPMHRCMRVGALRALHPCIRSSVSYLCGWLYFLAHRLVNSFIPSLIDSFIHSFVHSFSHSLFRSFTSGMHSYTQSINTSASPSMNQSVYLFN